MGTGDHVAHGDLEQGGVVTEPLHTPELVTLLATQHLMLSVSGNGEYGRGPGHVDDHHHPNSGQTGLAVLKIMQGCNQCLYMNSLTWFRGSSPEVLQ